MAGSHEFLDAAAWSCIAGSLQLSQRELEVVQGVFDELTTGAISHRLGISRHTVDTYIERIYRKVDVHSRVGIAVRVLAAYARCTAGHAGSGRPGPPTSVPSC